MRRALAAAWIGAAAIAIWALLGGIHGAGEPFERRFVSLLAWQLCATGALVATLAILGRGRPGFFGTFLAMLLHVALSALTGVLTLPIDHLSRVVMIQAAFAVLVASGWWLEAALGAREPAGLIALALGCAAILAPFGLDGWLETSPGMGPAADGIGRAIALSPPTVFCESLLGWDPFKHEPVYRAFRVGETVHHAPTPLEAAQTTFLAAAAVLAVALVAAVSRLWIRRLWSRADTAL